MRAEHSSLIEYLSDNGYIDVRLSVSRLSLTGFLNVVGGCAFVGVARVDRSSRLVANRWFAGVSLDCQALAVLYANDVSSMGTSKRTFTHSVRSGEERRLRRIVIRPGTAIR